MRSGRQKAPCADEAGGKERCRALVESLRVGHLLDAALVHECHLARHAECLVLVVCHEQEGRTESCWMRRSSLRITFRTFRSSAERGSSSSRKARLVDQRPRETDPLCLPAAQLRRGTLAQPLEPHEGQHVIDPLCDLLAATPPPTAPSRRQAKRDVLTHGQVREESVALKADIERSALGGRRMLFPLKRMSPPRPAAPARRGCAVGSSSRSRSNPRKPKKDPSGILRLTSERATTEPKRFVTPTTDTLAARALAGASDSANSFGEAFTPTPRPQQYLARAHGRSTCAW